MCPSNKSQQQAPRTHKLFQQGIETSPWRDGLWRYREANGYSERQRLPAVDPMLPGPGSCFNWREAIASGGRPSWPRVCLICAADTV